MERIGVRELRQYASRYLDRVATGESFEVTDRGRPVALLVPTGAERWADLIATGRVVPASLDGDLLDEEPVEYDGSISETLAEMRADER